MEIVAIAGGTGAVGRTITDAIARAGKHEALILSRTVATTPGDGPKRLVVDYSQIDQMKHALQANNVTVVVSALLLNDEDASQSQINLIQAAAASGTVTKFIPSEYYIDFNSPIPGSDLLANFQLESEAELSRHPELTWTLVRAGIFLDHITMPYNPKPTYIKPFWCFIDIDHEQCVIPGDGSQTLVLTHSTDLASYIERLIGLPASIWPRLSLVASNKVQVNGILSTAKKITGKQPVIEVDSTPFLTFTIGNDFKVTYNSAEDILKGHITPLPSNKTVFDDPVNGEFFREVELQVMLSMLSNAHDLPGKNLAELFPDVSVTKLEDFFRAGWELKQGIAKE